MAKRILVIEDDDKLARWMSIFLSTNGYQMFRAENGEEGVEMARLKKPHLIILDVTMPGIDGWQTLQVIRATKGIEKTPVLMCTALSRMKDIDMAFDLGANGYINKPFDMEKIIKKVEEVIK